MRHALRHAEKVSVSLCCDDLDTSRKDLFSTVRRTASRLMRLAKESGTGVLSPVYCKTPYRFQNDALRAVESTYAGHVQQADTAENMCVFRATSPYEEADFTAAKIRSLVLHEATATAIFPSFAVTANATRGCLPPRCAAGKFRRFFPKRAQSMPSR